MSIALPPDAAERLGQDAIRAYNVCRGFEEHATDKDNVRDIMHARVLGYLIIYSPSPHRSGRGCQSHPIL